MGAAQCLPKQLAPCAKPCRDRRWVVVAAAVAAAVAFTAMTAMEVHDLDSSATCTANNAIALPSMSPR